MIAKPTPTLSALAAAVTLLALPHTASADVYEIDKDHTEVRFTWDHVGMSRQGGRFRDVSGTLSFDPINPGASTVDVRIKVASISTGVPKLDDQLVRSGEFFDAQAFPLITFKSTSVAPSVDRKAQVTGNLTVNGVTKPVVLDVRWNFTGEHPLAPINPVYKETFSSGFSATTQILRSDFGISRTIPFVSDEIRITIETEMHRKQVTTSQPAVGPAAPDTSPEARPEPGAAPPAGLATRPALEVPAPGTPLPPVEGGPPHAVPAPPVVSPPPPVSDGITATPGAPSAVPDETAPGEGPDATGEPELLNSDPGFGNEKIDDGR